MPPLEDLLIKGFILHKWKLDHLLLRESLRWAIIIYAPIRGFILHKWKINKALFIDEKSIRHFTWCSHGLMIHVVSRCCFVSLYPPKSLSYHRYTMGELNQISETIKGSTPFHIKIEPKLDNSSSSVVVACRLKVYAYMKKNTRKQKCCLQGQNNHEVL
jgi:hypothetical protein